MCLCVCVLAVRCKRFFVLGFLSLTCAQHIRASQERFVPGMAEEVLVDFKPKEWRYHYDCIRVLAPNDQNMLIPIHGYPVVGESSVSAKK